MDTGADRADAVVVGAGPSGLGAALAMVRAGAHPIVVDAAPIVGGLCVTRRSGGFGYDIGGHIPFVNDEPRLDFLRELIGDRLRWVDRPVSCVRGGRIVRGRYLDQRPDGPIEPAEENAPTPALPAEDSRAIQARFAHAAGELGVRFGAEFVDTVQRAYLEKIDGLPLERIAAERVRRLLLEQAAPDGFWFPAGGIGELMDAMSDAIGAGGGEVVLGAPASRLDLTGGRARAVEVTRDGGTHTIATDDVVLAVPPGLAARLATPPAPAWAVPAVRMRAVAIVYVALDLERVTWEPWIQVDSPDVPFARAFEPVNWSPELAPAGRTVMGLECYCEASDDDPVWSLSDEALARRCAERLADPLGWVEPESARSAELVDVVRIAGAYPSPDVAQIPAAGAAGTWLSTQGGIHLARGAAVIDAIQAGERIAETILSVRAGSLAP